MRRTAEEAQATREALLNAALEVFAERGYAATRLEEVAARAGVTRGALYHHFPDKSALYGQMLAEAWQAVTLPIFAALETDAPPLVRLERFLTGYCVALDRDARFRSLLTVTMAPGANPAGHSDGLDDKQQALRAWFDQLAAVLREAADAGELRTGVDPADGARVLLCFLNGVTTTVLLAGDLLSPARQAAVLTDAVLGGLRRPT